MKIKNNTEDFLKLFEIFKDYCYDDCTFEDFANWCGNVDYASTKSWLIDMDDIDSSDCSRLSYKAGLFASAYENFKWGSFALLDPMFTEFSYYYSSKSRKNYHENFGFTPTKKLHNAVTHTYFSFIDFGVFKEMRIKKLYKIHCEDYVNNVEKIIVKHS